MKKIFICVVLFGLIFSLFACDTSKDLRNDNVGSTEDNLQNGENANGGEEKRVKIMSGKNSISPGRADYRGRDFWDWSFRWRCMSVWAMGEHMCFLWGLGLFRRSCLFGKSRIRAWDIGKSKWRFFCENRSQRIKNECL